MRDDPRTRPVDADRVAEIEAEVHHDVIAFVTAAAESIGDDGRFLHFGMTSSDVLDTAFALQLVEAATGCSRRLDGAAGRGTSARSHLSDGP